MKVQRQQFPGSGGDASAAAPTSRRRSIPARIHLLPAKQAPVVVILRRKPSRLFHVLALDTRTGAFEQGSWFYGTLYPLRCDVSFDGQWLVYFAMGFKADKCWNGVSKAPWLTCEAQGMNTGTWFGGGHWADAQTLSLNLSRFSQGTVPFQVESVDQKIDMGCLNVLYPRLRRDGWIPCNEHWERDERPTDATGWRPFLKEQARWALRPSPLHPTLCFENLGYREGYSFRFRLREHPGFLDDEVTWATYDCLGQLIVSRRGVVTVWNFHAHSGLSKQHEIDLESLEPPRANAKGPPPPPEKDPP